MLGGRAAARPTCGVTSLGLRVGHDGLVHARLHLSLPIPMVQLLPNPLIDFYELDQFLVQLIDTRKERKKVIN